VEGLVKNERRYGYQACPCRLASGDKSKDLDLVCPCDYRDPDLAEYGACYCGLYVTADYISGKKPRVPVPERRPVAGRTAGETKMKKVKKGETPVWRCRVCGYLCAMDSPPQVCPICKAGKERFERFSL
jgi:ferredoxin-thioredoxin reductase catalytic subunit